MNVFKEMALSAYSLGSYSEFLKNRKSKVFGFGALLIAIYFIVTVLIPSLVSIVLPSGVVQTLMANVPDFELRDGELWVEDVVEIDEGGAYIYIDTNSDYVFYDADETEQFLYDYSSALLMDSEKVIIKNNGEVQGFYFSDLNLDFDKGDIVKLLPWLYVLYVLVMVFAYICVTALFFFGVLFVALLGMIAASCMKYQLTFGQLYLMGIYSRTLPLLIKALVSFLPFHIPFFWVVNFGLSIFIIVMAIRKMKEQQPPMGYNYPPGYYM